MCTQKKALSLGKTYAVYEEAEMVENIVNLYT